MLAMESMVVRIVGYDFGLKTGNMSLINIGKQCTRKSSRLELFMFVEFRNTDKYFFHGNVKHANGQGGIRN